MTSPTRTCKNMTYPEMREHISYHFTTSVALLSVWEKDDIVAWEYSRNTNYRPCPHTDWVFNTIRIYCDGGRVVLYTPNAKTKRREFYLEDLNRKQIRRVVSEAMGWKTWSDDPLNNPTRGRGRTPLAGKRYTFKLTEGQYEAVRAFVQGLRKGFIVKNDPNLTIGESHCKEVTKKGGGEC